MVEPDFGRSGNLEGVGGQDLAVVAGTESTFASIQAALEEHSYPEASNEDREKIYSSFLPFIQRIQGDADLNETINMFAQLYFHDKNYEGIFALYERTYMDDLSEDEKDDAYDFFCDTFPELLHDEFGNLVMKPSTK